MGTGTLTDRSTGQTILDTFFNDIHGAMDGDFVGRNASGVATSTQNLGTVAIPWGTIRGSALILGGVAIDTSQITSQVNRIVSGKKRTTSNQPAFITPNGSATSFILYGATTNLVVDVNGSQVTVSTDITKSSLSVAPGSNNTCLVNDTAASSQAVTKTFGEFGNNTITVDAMGSSISALVGTYQSFKLVNAAAATEYFYAFVESSTKLSKAFRGYFYDSTLAPVNRIGFTDNDTITLMKTGYVFIQNDGTTIDVSYTNPIYAFTSPSGPAAGDYWYDLANSQWKRYDGSAWQIISRTLIGMVVMDATNCKVARCLPFYANFKRDNTIQVAVSTTEIVRATRSDEKINVIGNEFLFRTNLPAWNITTNLASSADMYDATEQASRMYYLYFKDTGDVVISDIEPYQRRDLLGWYHPHNPWRCVGSAYNNGSSNITGAAAISKQTIFRATGCSNTDHSGAEQVCTWSTIVDDDFGGHASGVYTVKKACRAYISLQLNTSGSNHSTTGKVFMGLSVGDYNGNYNTVAYGVWDDTYDDACGGGISCAVDLKVGDKVKATYHTTVTTSGGTSFAWGWGDFNIAAVAVNEQDYY